MHSQVLQHQQELLSALLCPENSARAAAASDGRCSKLYSGVSFQEGEKIQQNGGLAQTLRQASETM